MAISRVGGNATTYAGRTNTTITVSGYTIAADDIAFVKVVTAAAGSDAPDPTFAAGTLVGTACNAASNNNDFRLEDRLYYVRCSGGETSFSVNHALCSSQVLIDVWRGADWSVGPFAATQTQAVGTGATRTWTGLTTAVDNAVVIAFGSDWADTTNDLTPPSGMTERQDLTLSYIASEMRATAGATGNRSHTCNTAPLSGGYVGGWSARLIALRPAVTTQNYTLTAAAGALTLTGQSASLNAGRKLSAAAGSFTLAGQPATLAKGTRLAADAGAFALTGQPATLSRTLVLAAASGTFAITGQDAALRLARSLAASTGSYAITGQPAVLAVGRALVASPGAFEIAGQDAALRADRLLAADAGSFAIAGNDADLIATRRLAADAGSFGITGNAASLLYAQVGRYVLGADAGAFAIAGQAAGLRATRLLSGGVGSFDLSGQAASLGVGRRLQAEAGRIDLTGPDAGFALARVLAAEPGAFIIAGLDASLIAEIETAKRLLAEAGVFVIMGRDAALIWTRLHRPTLPTTRRLSPATTQRLSPETHSRPPSLSTGRRPRYIGD